MIKDLLINNDNKILFLILDQLGNIPDTEYTHQPPLEASRKPNIDFLSTKTGEQGGISFYKRNCIRGIIGTIHSKQLAPLVLAHAFKLDKYGA
jgi:2,3-bisphosphoglycerate-independent phosphoglycerate mutase